jgi:hypothetical protein
MENKKPHVLMFAPLCYPPAGSEAIVTSKLVLGMLEAGWQVKVISQADFGHFYPASDNEQWEPLLSVVENVSGINDKSFMAQLLGEKLTRKIKTLFWVIKAVGAGFIALKKDKYDFLLSRVAPQYGHLPALIVSRLTRIPWIAHWSDPLPVKKAPPPYGKGINAQVSLFLNMYSQAVFCHADWHTFPCERLMKYYWLMAPELKKKSSVIPHIALKKFCIANDEDKDIFTLCHTGSIAHRDLAVFFEGLKRFIKETKPAKKIEGIFIGDPVNEIRLRVQAAGVSDIVLVEAPKTYEETQSRAASSSVLLVIEATCEEGIFFPSKFVDFIQTGRPILALSPKTGTLSDILNKNDGGIAVDNRSVDEVLFALNKFYRAWEKKTLTTTYGSKKLFTHFCEEVVIAKYSELFLKLDKNGKDNL